MEWGDGAGASVIRHRCAVTRRPAERPADQDRNFGHFTVGASLGQLIGPIAAGQLVSGHDGALARTSAAALFVAAAVAACSVTSLWRIEHRPAEGVLKKTADASSARRVPVFGILRTRGVASGIFISLAVLSATDILTAYLPVVGEQRAISPAVVGLLLSLRAAATVACRLVMTPMIRLMGRTVLMAVSCLGAGLLCAAVALPLPAWALGVLLAALGFCLGVGQPLSMSTVVQAAPDEARSTALALRLTGNRLGQVAAPASAGLLAGLAGTAAPFVMLGVLLLGSAATAVRPLRRAADTAVPAAVPDARKPPPAPEGERSAVSGRCGPGEETSARTDPEEPTP